MAVYQSMDTAARRTAIRGKPLHRPKRIVRSGPGRSLRAKQYWSAPRLTRNRYSTSTCTGCLGNTRSASITGSHERLNSCMRDAGTRKPAASRHSGVNSRKLQPQVPV